MKLMTRVGLTFLSAFVFTQASAFAQTPIIEYTFNNTSSTTLTSSGSTAASATLTGTFGSGVSGQAGDYAFDNSASTGMGNLGTGGSVQLGSNVTTGLTSFTLQGWFKSGTALSNAARLIDGFNTVTTSGLQLRADAATNSLVLGVDGQSATSAASYGTTNSWVFFAATYDSVANAVKFYIGDTTTSVTQVGSTLSFGINPGAVDAPANNIAIGNLPGTNSRPYDGLLDDIRLFGTTSGSSGALSLSELETIRSLDAAVPEPASFALMTMGGVVLLLGQLKRRRSL